MQKLFWLLFVLIFTVQSNAAEKKFESDTVSVLFTQQHDTVTSDQPGLIQELAQYIKYYLEQKGYLVQSVLPADSSIPQASRHHRVYAVDIATAYTQPSITLEDSHRRQLIQRTDSLFSITINVSEKGTNNPTLRTYSEHGKTDWIDHALSRQDRNTMRRLSEPKEFIMQRATAKAFAEIPILDRPPRQAKKTIPVYWYVDSSYIREHGAQWEKQLRITQETASKRLQAQFNLSLTTESILTITIPTEETYSIERVLAGIKQMHTNDSDGLHVYLFSRSVEEQYFLTGSVERIGLAEIGQRLLVINDIPLPKSNLSWQPYYTSIILLHEFGHTMGGIHVSDTRSVMNHSINLASGGYFDKMNHMIISQAINGTLRFDSQQQYLDLVVRAIDSSRYQLADIPWMAYHFLIKNGLYKSEKAYLSKPGFKMYYTAGLGYFYLVNKNPGKAAELFREAIISAPFKQASLYYYLATISPENDERNYALSAAASLGYYSARLNKQLRYVTP